jgi:hypothetical protein
MVIKILKTSGSTFSAVNYNENKNDKGKGELLHTENMEAINGSLAKKEDIKNYLKLVSEANTHVKNPVFHAVISCKGREMSHEQLKNVGIEYMHHMGYKNSPFLIYGHNDNANNHIHIVSSRVNLDGKKIDQSYERIRSQAFLRDRGLAHTVHPDQGMKLASSFNYTTSGQIIALLQSKGFKARIKDDVVELIADGKSTKIPKEIYSNWIGEGDKQRIHQLKAIFLKYNSGQGFDTFSKDMKKKFGIDLLPHLSKDGNIYGYSIVDNSTKTIYKGSVIMPLNELTKKINTNQASSINKIIEESKSFFELRNHLKSYGLEVTRKGDILQQGEIIATIPANKIMELNANEKLKLASEMSLDSLKSNSALSRVIGVPLNDMKASIDVEKATILQNKVSGLIINGKGDSLNGMGIFIYKDGKTHFAIDFKNKIFSALPENLIREQMKVRDITPQESISVSHFKNQQNALSIQNATSMISQIVNQRFGEQERERKRKRHIN